MIEPTLVLACE